MSNGIRIERSYAPNAKTLVSQNNVTGRHFLRGYEKPHRLRRPGHRSDHAAG